MSYLFDVRHWVLQKFRGALPYHIVASGVLIYDKNGRGISEEDAKLGDSVIIGHHKETPGIAHAFIRRMDCPTHLALSRMPPFVRRVADRKVLTLDTYSEADVPENELRNFYCGIGLTEVPQHKRNGSGGFWLEYDSKRQI